MPKKSCELESLAWLKDVGAPALVDVPKISANGRTEMFTQGRVSFEFSRSLTNFFNALRELDLNKIRALARSWGYEAPAEIDELLVRPLVYASLQNYWYMEVRGEIPSSIIAHSTDRIHRYLKMIKKYHQNPEAFKPAEPKVRLHHARADAFYTVLKADAKLNGQAALVFDALLAGFQTLAEITEHVDASGRLKTKQPTERVVKFYLNQFRHDKLIIQSTKPFNAETKKTKGGEK